MLLLTRYIVIEGHYNSTLYDTKWFFIKTKPFRLATASCHNNEVELGCYTYSPNARAGCRWTLISRSWVLSVLSTPATNRYIIKKIIIFLYVFFYTIISALPLKQLISTIHCWMGCFPFRPSMAQREHGDQVRVKFKLYICLHFVQW